MLNFENFYFLPIKTLFMYQSHKNGEKFNDL